MKEGIFRDDQGRIRVMRIGTAAVIALFVVFFYPRRAGGATSAGGGTFEGSSRNHRVAAFTIAGGLMIAPAVAGNPIDLSVDPPKAKADPGLGLSLGRLGLDPCPGGLCRTESHTDSFYFITPKGARPIAVPGIRLSIPLDNSAR